MRRKRAPKRKIIPDAKFSSEIVARFINRLMDDGKKSVVEKSVYDAFAMIEKKIGKPSMVVFEEVLDNVTPRIEVRSRRIGGATYQIPVEVPDRRGSALALKWLKIAISKSSGKSLSQKINNAIIDAVEKRGWAIKKREEVFKMAESNKAFAHYRW